MRPSTTISDYRDQAVFDREQVVLFQESWQFAGFARDLKEDGEYIVADAGGKSVVVQNFEGELKGFLNVCSHRFSAIRHECKGKGTLQCPYHGWVYDRAGIPVGIANIKDFGEITDERRRQLALESRDVARCGELVFVRRNSGTPVPEFKEWLGDAWSAVESIGSSLGEQLDCNRLTVDSNWKVAVENTLESYHVKSVHPTTFARLNAQTNQFLMQGLHSGWQATIQPSTQKMLHRLVRQLGVNSNFEGYFHQFIFPSLTLATTEGLTYSIQTFRPLSVNRTEFTSYVFAAAHSGNEDQRNMLLAACRPAIKFNREVFEEDRVICGEAQRGIQMAASNLAGILSDEERRVEAFQRVWKQTLSTAA